MSDIVVRVDGLGKRYRVGSGATRRTFRETLSASVRAPMRRLGGIVTHGLQYRSWGYRPDDSADFWALRDVSFEVRQGQAMGIIGRNGAGKSTLLRILSRITEPTEGRVALRGRVGSLLEVGTGFHPELTGRENVYLNGAILGMKRAEVKQKFADIVEFAEVGRFIDTPVKRYSSGMYMRLAFAVAAHLEPEILIVDEVLAVGDAAFQRKCLGKMGDVAQSGRTVLFVSHNMVAVQRLCEQVVWLDQGQVVDLGPAGPVVSRYLQTAFAPVTERRWDEPDAAPGNEQVRLHRARVRRLDGSPAEPITVRTAFALEFEYWNLKPGASLNLSIHVFNEDGIVVFNAGPRSDSSGHPRPFPVGLFRDTCIVPADLMNDGVHRVELLVVKDQTHIIHREQDVLIFDIHDALETRDAWHGKWVGAARPALDWETRLIEPALTSPVTANEVG